MSVSSLLLCLCVVSLSVVMADETKSNGFSFYEYMHGEWVITRSSYLPHSSLLSTSDYQTHYHIQKENDTQHLIGQSYDNDTITTEISNQNLVHIEFTSPVSGIWRAGMDEDTMNTQFKFEFLPQTHDLQISAGEWTMNEEQHNRLDDDDEPTKPTTKSTKPAYYIFQIATWDKFIITVFHIDEITQEKQIYTLYQGQKIPKPVEISWFESHKTMLMLVGIFIFQMFIKYRAAQREMQKTKEELSSPSVTTGDNKKNK